MKSQLDPKMILKNAKAGNVSAALPTNCPNHATKYPNGVFQSNGYLRIYMHQTTLFSFARHFNFNDEKIVGYEPSKKVEIKWPLSQIQNEVIDNGSE